MNDLVIYDMHAEVWWDDSVKWLRTLRSMVPARLRYFDKHIKDWPGAKTLDLGCGGGFMAEALAKRGAVVTGIDPAVAAINAAQNHARIESLEVSYLTGVGEDLPFEDDHFDVVVCVDVLEHVSNLDATLDEVARTLRPGGIFVFDTLNRNGLAKFAAITVAERLTGLLPKGTHDPSLFIKPGEIKHALLQRGLCDVEFQGFGPIALNRNYDFVFGPLPFTTIQYLGKARLGTA